MSHCDQKTITDAAFAHLAGIHTLDMSGCNQWSITGAAFERLSGIKTLVVRGCKWSIADEAFPHMLFLRGPQFPGPFSHLVGTTIVR